jgi:hypothetical protein
MSETSQSSTVNGFIFFVFVALVAVASFFAGSPSKPSMPSARVPDAPAYKPKVVEAAPAPEATALPENVTTLPADAPADAMAPADATAPATAPAESETFE